MVRKHSLSKDDIILVPFTNNETVLYNSVIKEGVWPTKMIKIERLIHLDYPETNIFEVITSLEEFAAGGFEDVKVYDRDYDNFAVTGVRFLEDEELIMYDTVVNKLREFEKSHLYQDYKRFQENAELKKQELLDERDKVDFYGDFIKEGK